MKTFSFPLLMCSLLLFLSCNSLEDFEDLDLLVDHEWRLVSIQQDGVEMSDTCDLDDVLLFTADNEFEDRAGDLLCPVENGDRVIEIEAATWRWQDKRDVLRLTYKTRSDGALGFGSMVRYWELLTLNDSMLIIDDVNAEINDMIPEVRTYKR